jgi:hypothetical protein
MAAIAGTGISNCGHCRGREANKASTRIGWPLIGAGSRGGEDSPLPVVRFLVLRASGDADAGRHVALCSTRFPCPDHRQDADLDVGGDIRPLLLLAAVTG